MLVINADNVKQSVLRQRQLQVEQETHALAPDEELELEELTLAIDEYIDTLNLSEEEEEEVDAFSVHDLGSYTEEDLYPPDEDEDEVD